MTRRSAASGMAILIYLTLFVGYSAQAEDVGVVVRIRTAKQSYEASEPIVLYVGTVADRDTTLMETSTTSLVEYDIEVVLPTKERASFTEYGKWLRAGNAYTGTQAWPLRKSSHTEGQLHLSRLVDMTLAGEYQITIKQHFMDVDRKKPGATVTSNTVRVKVTNDVTIPTTAPAKDAAGQK